VKPEWVCRHLPDCFQNLSSQRMAFCIGFFAMPRESLRIQMGLAVSPSCPHHTIFERQNPATGGAGDNLISLYLK